MNLAELRQEYHRRVCTEIIRKKSSEKYGEECPNFADGTNRSSIDIAWGIVERPGCGGDGTTVAGQTAGKRFEDATKDFLQRALDMLRHLRPGEWEYSTRLAISRFDQYRHLVALEQLADQHREFASALGSDYIIKPDIVIGRWPVSDQEINEQAPVLRDKDRLAEKTPLRDANSDVPNLHASISCKWTICSDRAQNPRTEALNLIRNRKGNVPHIALVTAEPLPMRIASIAMGTGDLDCVNHFALPELEQSVKDAQNEDQLEMLHTLVEGRRLRDISDLPFDLAA